MSSASFCAVSAAVIAGCETIGQDINDLAAAIKPVSPAEAARDMVDPYDADKRRTGTVLISNAPFGGVEVYVKAYRDMVLYERDPIVKATAIRALARWGEPSDAILIAANLRICDDCVRKSASQPGGPYKSKDCVSPACYSDSIQVRWEAAKGLQRLHNPAVVPDLIKTMNNENEHEDVRIAAATALGQYPEDRAFQGLVFALNARELAINQAAERSLYDMTGQRLGLDPPTWLDWYNAHLKKGDAFAGKIDYFYPVYWREDTFWEKLMFWTSRNFESPGQPAGLRPKDERRTYEDSDEPPPIIGPQQQ